MTKSTQRAHDASKPKSATGQRRNETRTSEPLKAGKAKTGIPATDHESTGVTPNEFFKAWSRKDREALIEVLIDTLDAEAGDADLEETGDDELSLGFQTGDVFVGRGCESGGSWHDDREVEDEHDEDTCDREEVCEDEGAEHDGTEPDVDGEPSLGFLECFTGSGRSGQAGGCFEDREADGSYLTEEARARYKPFDRYTSNGNRDGRHVDSERGFGRACRKLKNLSDVQRAAVKPRLNRDEVSIW